MVVTEWNKFLGSFDRYVLQGLGHDVLPTDHNPVTRALQQDAEGFVARFQGDENFNRINISRLATICQMAVYDAQMGPERDGKVKALRRHWYAWYKSQFAQPFSRAMGDQEVGADGVSRMNDTNWAARLSVTYGNMVDYEGLTYRALWVEDASRMMKAYYDGLFQGCYIIVAVEKDSLFSDFLAPARALGAMAVYSGKGKSSKAGIEKLLREAFGWKSNWTPFSEESPLIVLHISDYDYDGEAVIGPTFAEQARRYTEHILEARAGIQPVQMAEELWPDNWYEIKLANKGYKDWAGVKALFMASCVECGREWPVIGLRAAEWCLDVGHGCPACESSPVLLQLGINTAYGFEVEAMETRDYYALIVDALLQVLPFDYIVRMLREECMAYPPGAAETLLAEVLGENQDYQDLLAEFERLADVKRSFEDAVRDELTDLGEPHKRDWQDEDPDPEPEEFRLWMRETDGYRGPWKPFSWEKQTERLVAFLRETAADVLERMKMEVVEWRV